MKNKPLRAVVEICSIVFLFYSNLVMGEFTRSGAARNHGLMWAIRDTITRTNFAIGLGAALVGYVIFESLRNRL